MKSKSHIINKGKIVISSCIILTMIIGIISLYEKDTYSFGCAWTSGSSNILENVIMNQSKATGWEAGAEGLYQDENGDYRYVGANPDNWLIFNGERYQIIGMFGKDTHGLEGYRVKIIRAKSLGAYSWGIYNKDKTSGIYSGYSNNWIGTDQSSPSNSYVLLNEFFYNAKDTSETYGKCEDWTYYDAGENNKNENCDIIKNYGISATAKSYIETEVTWHLYGDIPYRSNKQNMYKCERGIESDGCDIANYESIKATIGLLYPSDYVYASGYYGNTDTISFERDKKFSAKNWLYLGGEATISHNTTDDIISISDLGSLRSESANFSSNLRPVFYLKTGNIVMTGNGTYDNPYQLC